MTRIKKKSGLEIVCALLLTWLALVIVIPLLGHDCHFFFNPVSLREKPVFLMAEGIYVR